MRPTSPGALRTHDRKAASRAAKPDGDRLFGRYDDLVRLVLGFVLTGIVGTYLSHRYTTQQADLGAATKVFNEHSKLIGDRYFAMDQVTALLRSLQHEPTQRVPELEPAWGRYKVVLQEWNSTRGFNREMIKLYFGQPIWNAERDVHYQFRAWGQSLEAERKMRGTVDFVCLDKKVDSLLAATHALRAAMAQAMQEGRVGSSRPGSNTQENPREEVWCIAVPQDAPVRPSEQASSAKRGS